MRYYYETPIRPNTKMYKLKWNPLKRTIKRPRVKHCKCMCYKVSFPLYVPLRLGRIMWLVTLLFECKKHVRRVGGLANTSSLCSRRKKLHKRVYATISFPERVALDGCHAVNGVFHAFRGKAIKSNWKNGKFRPRHNDVKIIKKTQTL